jgi:hypothetical protein
MLSNDLLSYIFDGQDHALSEPIAAWLTSSRRFTAFTDTFRDKIRKKIRVTKDTESIQDLRLELETAYFLLREPRLSLVYEPQMSEKIRAPDFAVTFTTSLTFLLEVTRVRGEPAGPPPATVESAASPILDRLTDAVCSKLGQFLPQRSNVLLIGVAGISLTDAELRATMIRLQQRAEADTAAFLQRYRFRDRAEFFQRYLRLSEIVIRNTDIQGAKEVVSWTNPQARQPLPGKVQSAFYRSQLV